MAGIYIHIPFCKQKCTYCDFFKVVAPALIDEFTDTLVQEIELKRNYLGNATISSIYFGGGTPSLLSSSQLKTITDKIFSVFPVNNDCEITLEANPDDLSEDFIKNLSSLPFNRLSVGIQSFDDRDLKLLNRRHNGLQAKNVIINAKKSGFRNISVDLIYGIPGQTIEMWDAQLNQALELDVEHISAYGLTYEEGTALWTQRKKGKVEETDDEVMIKMYELMLLKFKDKAYEAYEISNFSKPGFRSRHNSAYWKFTPYVGLGPSAHSFNGISRQWNASSISGYNLMVKNGEECESLEILTPKDIYNDFVMVSLRTSEGIDLKILKEMHGQDAFEYCLRNAGSFISRDFLSIRDEKLLLTENGVRISNLIICELMKTD